jgi:hypothetical protein
MTGAGKNRIMIFGPKEDGPYAVKFRTADGEALAISIPRSDAAVIRHFQEADALQGIHAGKWHRVGLHETSNNVKQNDHGALAPNSCL